jgi:hypothetical protein
MSSRTYLAVFFAVVTLAMLALVAFNLAADRFILWSPNGPSFQTVSGFERVIKPAWLDSIKPDTVFVGSSGVRDGFDPRLIDPALGLHSFNYGVSGITAYEARRFFQDAAAQPSVKTIVMAADAFAAGTEAQTMGAGFDELRLAVTADGAPTPRRQFWLFTTRTLSGGAVGMHALGLYMLAQLAPGQTAADRPDIFSAYGHMTEAGYDKDVIKRNARRMWMNDWQRGQLRAALDFVCHRNIRVILFFAPYRFAMIERFMANDADALFAFKRGILAEAAHHNASCQSKITLVDFLNANALTLEEMKDGKSANYVDLVHFRPPAGLHLLRRMLTPQTEPEFGVDLTALADPEAQILHLRQDVAAWKAAR